MKSRLKKLILRRPPIQALQEKGLIKGELSKAGEHAKVPYTLICNRLRHNFYIALIICYYYIILYIKAF